MSVSRCRPSVQLTDADQGRGAALLPRRVQRVDRGRRPQPPGPARRPHRSPDRGPARVLAVPAPDRLPVQPAVHRGDAGAPRVDQPPARRAVLDALRSRSPSTTIVETETRSASRDRRGARCGAEPRRRSHAARVAGVDRRHRAHQRVPSGATAAAHRPVLSFKFDTSKVPDLPLPRPMFEIWVCSPRVEGVHLRNGRIARGGIRWSDRREDFRTEVLGLVKAQIVKNAVIVPTGAKGGFVLKRAAGRRRRVPRRRCGLLPRVHQRSARPHRQHRRRCHRAAARHGAATTATIRTSSSPPTRARPPSATSPTRSPPTTASGWATRSHPVAAPATTTRPWASRHSGAWESVRRHARALGKDADHDELTIVGIGDMSGDVFGNGMLRSPHLKLVAAFDHRHIFIDPDPDPAVSFAERKRLFDLPRSSWADYDTSLLSAGGGVYPRTLKTITIEPGGAASGWAPTESSFTPERTAVGHPARAGRPVVERRHRHVRQGVDGDRTPRSAIAPTTACASTASSCAAEWSARAATSV